MKKKYITPALKFSGIAIDTYLILLSGDDDDNSRKSKLRGDFDEDDEIVDQDDFWK